MRKTKLERFFKYVNKLENGCWKWLGFINADGYGVFSIGSSKSDRAHRESFRLFNGLIPRGMSVCHSCDNPSCVNPDHLWLGTQLENVRDMMGKGRNGGISINPMRGEQHPNAKFTEEQIKFIRSSPKTNGDLGREFRVGYKTIWKIRKRQIWKHI